MNDFVIAENAEPAIPFAASNAPLIPLMADVPIPPSDVAIEPNPLVKFVPIPAAKLPPAIALLTAPCNPLAIPAAAPVTLLNAPVTAPAAALAEFCTKSFTAPMPT